MVVDETVQLTHHQQTNEKIDLVIQIVAWNLPNIFVIPVYFVNHVNWILSIDLSTSEFKSDAMYRRFNNQKSIIELYLRNQFNAEDSSSLPVPETSNTSSTDV
jgi:hypothetical protein